jgi:hypothetical protein
MINNKKNEKPFQIKSYCIDNENDKWLEQFTTKLQSKYDFTSKEINTSRVLNLILEMIRESNEIEQFIVNEKALEMKVKALKDYLKKKAEADKLTEKVGA